MLSRSLLAFAASDHTELDPFDVVIDGRTLTWSEFGQALHSFEGWRFRMTIEDPCDDLRPDAIVHSLGPDPKGK
jgi:hypothetical protein